MAETDRESIRRQLKSPRAAAAAGILFALLHFIGMALVLAIDNPAGDNEFRYKVGWDLDSTTGVAASWSSRIDVPGIGDATDGGGAALADINGNGRPDLVLMGIDDPVALALSLIKRARHLLLGLPALLAWHFSEGRRLVTGLSAQGLEADKS